MKKLLVIMLFLSFLGCKGEKGPSGDRGAIGLPGRDGTSNVQIISGAVTSNDFFVTDTRIGRAANISIYLSDGVGLTELPYYLPSFGTNTFSVTSPSLNQVEIVNASMAGATQYLVAIITQ